MGADNHITVDIGNKLCRSNYLKALLIDILKLNSVSISRLSDMFYITMECKRNDLVKGTNSEALFDFPTSKQIVTKRNEIVRSIIGTNRYLSYDRFTFIVEDILQLPLPNDRIFCEIKRRHDSNTITIGRRFGRLIVLEKMPKPYNVSSRSTDKFYKCQCDCGKIVTTRACSLTLGRTQSCGCLAKECASEIIKKRCTTHGMSHIPEYGIWKAITQRCTNPNDKNYTDYGGRGILVCEKWKDFASFYSDMGPRPAGTSIDRRDNNGNYEPGNCYWASKIEQSNNRRNTIFVGDVPFSQWVSDNYLPGRKAYHLMWHNLYKMRRVGMTDDMIKANLKKLVDTSPIVDEQHYEIGEF